MSPQKLIIIIIIIVSILFANIDASSPRRQIRGLRTINRRRLIRCLDPNPYIQLQTSSGGLSDDGYVTVNVTGILVPSKRHWVGMISPSHSNVTTCLENALKYVQTGDLSSLPLLCHYPVKAQYVSNDPDFLKCAKQECKKRANGECLVKTCGATLSFHVINIRTDIEFVLFGGGFQTPCILKRSTDQPLSFANPNKPLYGHLSSTDSSGSSMRLRWVSGDRNPQQVLYGNGRKAASSVSSFSQADMCTSNAGPFLESPAVDFGWHDPGYIHSAVMTGFSPSTSYSYKYGSNSVGWSDKITFKTPPAGGSTDELVFLAYGDMGKAPFDSSVEHFIQPGSVSVIKAMTDEVSSGHIDSIFHIGDISYATGFLVEWDFFLHLITPLASRVSYMTAIGNHERDYVNSGSVYMTPDSGGECGVPYETYFPMPSANARKGQAMVLDRARECSLHSHFNRAQLYEWMKRDMAGVSRTKTPWLIFAGHRPMYTSSPGSFLPSVDGQFVEAVEPLLLENKVDLALFGHVHNYERTCAVYQGKCRSMPKKDGKSGIDTYDNTNYSAPVHAIIGMAGFALDNFTKNDNVWSLSRISQFGYIRTRATRKELNFEFVNAASRSVGDSFRITKT